MAKPPKKLPMSRKGFGTRGQSIQLLTNHFRVSVRRMDGHFYHYHVEVKYEDGGPVEAKGVCRRVVDKLQETYASELAGREFAYNGEKGLFTAGALLQTKHQFVVVMEDASSSGRTTTRRSSGGDDGSPGGSDRKRMKRPMAVKKFMVEISFAAKDPMSAIAEVLRGQETENSMEALRVLDITLRQHSAKQALQDEVAQNLRWSMDSARDTASCPSYPSAMDGWMKTGVPKGGREKISCRGFHSSFRPTDSGLSLNVDVSTTMIVRPGPVIEFLLFNQNIKNPHEIDWGKAKCALKNLRIKTTHTGSEFRIIGLSEDTCYSQTFQIKRKNGNGGSDTVEEVTVFEYYRKNWKIDLKGSAHFPCLNVGKPKRPTYIPLELCHLVPLQRYKKALSTLQRSTLVERSRQNPQERMFVLSGVLRDSDYNSVPMLRECGISIAQEFTQVAARVLPAPKLKSGDGEDIFARNGRWNFNKNRLIQPKRVQRWVVVNFSAQCNAHHLAQRLIHCGNLKGLPVDPEDHVFQERSHMGRERAETRVNDMFQQLLSGDKPSFVLCVLPERKNCDIYGPWKRMCLVKYGIVTQCLAPTKINDQYLTNVLLKINAKLGGLNSLLQIERNQAIPLLSKTPTIILGMDVSHGSPGRDDVPSVAAVVSSLEWPLISKYKASVCTQSPRLEMIDSLFKLVGNEDHVIIRDGVSEGQFNQVLNIELAQIIKACEFLANEKNDSEWSPKFTVIVAQKNHHTKFFQTDRSNKVVNVPPGTVVDKGICHPRNCDFYMCAHAGMIGTTRPTHYHVLHDENNFTPDDLQELVHNLSYVYQRSTTAISGVAPICYAHLAAAQVSQFVRLDDAASEGSGDGGAPPRPVPELPRLHPDVRQSMFFC
ncbi:zwille protein -like [Oryza sativa Japonica Group]|nr:zwille protein -like [Oryza sativa Japonica Group]